jgi:hypothetical protein
MNEFKWRLWANHFGEPSPQSSPKGRGGDSNSLSLWERVRVRANAERIRGLNAGTIEAV